MATTTVPRAKYEVHPKEQFYFALKVFFSIIIYYLLYKGIRNFLAHENPLLKGVNNILVFYAVFLVAFLIFRILFLVGYLKGNAIKVSSKQFPDIFNIVHKQTELLGMSRMPDVYILQSGGILNAFATSFMGTNYVVIYSDILAAAYEQNEKVVEFVIGHEMGHIKRHHLLKKLILLPGAIIPFLGFAYSRACEYTCDRIGYALCPEGARPGMLLLASGRGLLKKVNAKAYMEQIYTEDGFTRWFAEKMATHPNTTKRVRAFDELDANAKPEPIPIMETVAVKKEDDLSRYMPQ